MIKSYQVKISTEMFKEPLGDDQINNAMATLFKNYSHRGETMTMDHFGQIMN
jgi:hypothetical protein